MDMRFRRGRLDWVVLIVDLLFLLEVFLSSLTIPMSYADSVMLALPNRFSEYSSVDRRHFGYGE